MSTCRSTIIQQTMFWLHLCLLRKPDVVPIYIYTATEMLVMSVSALRNWVLCLYIYIATDVLVASISACWVYRTRLHGFIYFNLWSYFWVYTWRYLSQLVGFSCYWHGCFCHTLWRSYIHLINEFDSPAKSPVPRPQYIIGPNDFQMGVVKLVNLIHRGIYPVVYEHSQMICPNIIQENIFPHLSWGMRKCLTDAIGTG